MLTSTNPPIISKFKCNNAMYPVQSPLSPGQVKSVVEK